MKLLRLAAATILASALLFAASVTGKWNADIQTPNGDTRHVTFDLKADGAALSGTAGGPRGDTPITDGKVDGENISFTVTREFNGNQFKLLYKGKVDGDTIHFTVMRDGGEGQGREFDAKRGS